MNPPVDIIAGSGADSWLIYLSLAGFLVTISVLVSLLTERERALIPTIIGSVVVIATIALFTEYSYGAGGLVRSIKGYGGLVVERTTLFVNGSPEVERPEPEVIIVEKIIEKEVRVEVIIKERRRRGKTQPKTPKPRLSVTMDRVPTEKTARVKGPEIPPPPPREVVKTEPTKAAVTLKQPKTEPIKAAKRTDKPKAMPPPTDGGRTDEGLVLPTGNLVIKLNTSIMETLSQKASKARLNIYFDGKYIGGRSAGLRTQKDAEGNPVNFTYIWKNPIFRLSNMATGNHRISIKVSIKGGGGRSRRVWSGTVYIKPGKTTNVVLSGNWRSGSLTRVR